MQNPGDITDQPTQAAASDDKDVSSLLVFGIMWRRRYSIVLTTIVLSILAAAGAMQLRPSFMATASVLVQERKTSVTDSPTTAGVIATDAVAVQTQVDILRSPDLARVVVRRLDLVDMPDFMPHPGLLTRLLDSLHGLDRTGVMERLGLVDSEARPPLTAAEREEYATKVLLEKISVVNDGRSYLIEIRAKIAENANLDATQAAALSADLANAYADAYVQFTGRIKSDNIRQANRLFDDRIAVLRNNMQTAEHAVQAYRTQNGLVEDRAASTDGRSVTIAGQQMARLNLDLTAAIAERARKEASLNQITAAHAGIGNLQSVPEVVASPLIQRLREQQAELGAREAALSMSHGPRSPELVAVHASQRDVEVQIAQETAKIAASLSSGVAAARNTEMALRAQLAELQGQVGAQGQTEVKLHELQNEADVAKMLYAAYLRGSEETANQIDVQEPDAVLVSKAGIPLGEAPPTRRQLAMVGAIVSFILAVLMALARERAQSGFSSAEDLEARTGITSLGFVPQVRHLRDALRFRNAKSAFSEAIFSIRALLRLNARNAPKVIMVTSAVPQEGKTVFSSSLARNAALAGQRALLIDCDLRRPAVAQHITTTDAVATDAVMMDGAPMEGVTIRRDTNSPLDVIILSAGACSPQDFFASTSMATLMATVRARYDLVVLDTPPVLAVTDARVLSVLSDVTILVVRHKTTPYKLVSRSVSELRSSGARLVGTVISQINLQEVEASDSAQAYIRRHYAKYVPS